MIKELIMRQMAATKASAEALIQSIEMFEAMVAQEPRVPGKAPDPGSAPPPPVTVPVPVPVPAPSTDENGVCRHPKEYCLPTPTMGNLRRLLCGVCGAEVKSESDEQPSSKEEG